MMADKNVNRVITVDSNFQINGDKILEKEGILGIINEGADYHPVKELSLEQVTKLYKEVGDLIDTFVPDDVKTSAWIIRDSTGFIQKVRKLKTQYGYYGFRIAFDYAEEHRWLMWFESRSDELALIILADREMNLVDSRFINNKEQAAVDKLPPMDRILKTIYDANKGVHEYYTKPSLRILHDEPAFIPLESVFKEVCNCLLSATVETNFEAKVRPGNMIVSDFHIGLGLAPLGSRDSGGHGYDISTNGGRHKKVVTGKAGNQYPVAKRRGVK